MVVDCSLDKSECLSTLLAQSPRFLCLSEAIKHSERFKFALDVVTCQSGGLKTTIGLWLSEVPGLASPNGSLWMSIGHPSGTKEVPLEILSHPSWDRIFIIHHLAEVSKSVQDLCAQSPRAGSVTFQSECNTFVLKGWETCHEETLKDMPQGVSVRPLECQHLDLVYDSWKFAAVDPSTRHWMRQQIELGLGFATFVDDVPVSWILCYR
eukprot:snap_masked-scaffold757_size101632-processed-gene-0.14 protein:Tk09871 transcript:snap_masked-scaffold757_size101632-processed-gene-0.14-mRNA-1 annotation:"PREDICTED: uncharacterized protein LOC100167398"